MLIAVRKYLGAGAELEQNTGVASFILCFEVIGQVS
jgi:hypothetical protein